MNASIETTTLTLHQILERFRDGSLNSKELVAAYRRAWEADNATAAPVHGYIEFFDDAEALAAEADKRRAAGDASPRLGAPIAVKDNILIAGRVATCGSNILEGFRAPYSATVIDRLLAAGMVPIGRTNMDEFAMGSSCEYSAYGPSRNPHDRERTPGGSSGGSAAVVAAGHAPAALGSETGGSVRLPASFCGLYGLKPSYGTLSRYGLVAFGSSLDQIGILARCPEDIALLLATAAGTDLNDATSEDLRLDGLRAPGTLKPEAMRGVRIAIPEEFLGGGADAEVAAAFQAFVTWAEKSGAKVDRVSLPILEAGVAIYYIIAPAEASSNLSRYDGVRYGARKRGDGALADLYLATRNAGFGPEVKRRILLGNYVLSSGYYDAYYKKAQAVRTLLDSAIADVFSSHDLVLAPTAPTPAFKIGQKVDDPLAMYLSDVYTTFANLAQIPALSVPVGTTEIGLPIGAQLIGPRFSEEKLLRWAKTWYEDAK